MATNEAQTGLTTLNVVFHGTMLFWVKPEHIEVLLPKVNMHVYYAGNWQRGKLEPLAEGGTYTLRNVEGPHPGSPPAKFDKDDNIIVKEAPDDSSRTLRRIILPRPRHIATLQHLTLEKANFEGSQAHIDVPAKGMGLIHVLTYDLIPGRPPELEGVPSWRPIPSEISDKTANLHIFADPPARVLSASMMLKHPEEAFKALMRLFPNKYPNVQQFQFQYLKNQIPLVVPDDNIRGRLGIRKIELVSLSISNLLHGDQLQSHGVVPGGRATMASGGMTAGSHMAMSPHDVGCHIPYNCASGVGGGDGG